MSLDDIPLAAEADASTSKRLSLLVRMPDGGVLSASAAPGTRLSDALAGFGIPIRAEPRTSDGAPPPTVHITQPWSDRMPTPVAQERAALVAQGACDGTRRLLSQVVLTTDLDGLEVELRWDALVPQTYWVAG